MNKQAAWLVTYDIRDPRRLVRLHRFLCRLAVPVQYSVFTLRASAREVGMLADNIESRIDVDVDDVRIYRIPEPALVTVWGRPILPRGILMADANTRKIIGGSRGRGKRRTGRKGRRAR